MILHDTHIHTEFSTDSKAPLSSQLSKATQLGLKGICLTDHMDYEFPVDQYPTDDGTSPFTFDLAAYKEEIFKQKEVFSSLEISTGVECGMQINPIVIQKNTDLSNDPDLDYIIGSLHLVDRKDPYARSFWKNQNAPDLVTHYFEQLYENLLAFHRFDSLGHLDYIVRYAPDSFHYDPKDNRELVIEILSFLIRHDIALEINTSGWKATPNPNPHFTILKWYQQLGGKLITIGSDAHDPEHLGFCFERLRDELSLIGFHEYVTFNRHTPVIHAL